MKEKSGNDALVTVSCEYSHISSSARLPFKATIQRTARDPVGLKRDVLQQADPHNIHPPKVYKVRQDAKDGMLVS